MTLFGLILGTEWVDPEDPTVIAETELLGAAASIEAAAKKLEQLKPRAKPKVSVRVWLLVWCHWVFLQTAVRWSLVCLRRLVSFPAVRLPSCPPALPARHLCTGNGEKPTGGSFRLTTQKNTCGLSRGRTRAFTIQVQFHSI